MNTHAQLSIFTTSTIILSTAPDCTYVLGCGVCFTHEQKHAQELEAIRTELTTTARAQLATTLASLRAVAEAEREQVRSQTQSLFDAEQQSALADLRLCIDRDMQAGMWRCAILFLIPAELECACITVHHSTTVCMMLHSHSSHGTTAANPRLGQTKASS
jgi:hypothetical protein